MTATDFRVEQDVFHGPLDLLLYLVRRNEIDPLHIRVSRIVEQFLEFLDVLQTLDFDLIGDFVVMSSALIEIKSRLVLPQPEEDESAESLIEDSDSGLIRHLLEYKKYRDAASALEEQAAEWQERYPRLTDDRPRSGRDPAADLIREVELWDLVAALSRILKYRQIEEEASIRYDETPTAVYAERVRRRVAAAGRVAFSTFFEGECKRSRIVGVFLAILELVRHYGYRGQQSDDGGEIWILPPTTGSTD